MTTAAETPVASSGATLAATTIATLGPSVRLIVFRFLMKNNVVPTVIPFVPIIHDPKSVRPDEKRKGKMVLSSTSDVWLAPLVNPFLYASSEYTYVGARVAEKRGDGKSDVRFTFCQNKHDFNDSERHSDFVSKRNDLTTAFTTIATRNLWITMAHLNPYISDDRQTGQSILVFDSTGRREAIKPDGTHIMIYEGGREKSTASGQIGRGIGPKISLVDKACYLVLSSKNNIQLIKASI